jgi:hypothetical protein
VGKAYLSQVPDRRTTDKSSHPRGYAPQGFPSAGVTSPKRPVGSYKRKNNTGVARAELRGGPAAVLRISACAVIAEATPRRGKPCQALVSGRKGVRIGRELPRVKTKARVLCLNPYIEHFQYQTDEFPRAPNRSRRGRRSQPIDARDLTVESRSVAGRRALSMSRLGPLTRLTLVNTMFPIVYSRIRRFSDDETPLLSPGGHCASRARAERLHDLRLAMRAVKDKGRYAGKAGDGQPFLAYLASRCGS